ncbi:hypothetical protein [Demequina gelatinilytica]|uniref:hypothetical protein n=1 Tax=Demequina gelatinilytica TaxID=1638980 RepID=UPI00078099FE|nr:hypothetical protein [Demequina gelatinilytica]
MRIGHVEERTAEERTVTTRVPDEPEHRLRACAAATAARIAAHRAAMLTAAAALAAAPATREA